VAVALVDPAPTIRTVLVDHLRSLNVVAVAYENLSPLEDAEDRAAPVVVVIGPSEDPENVLPKAQSLLKERPNAGVVMLVFHLTPEIVQAAFRNGIDDVVAVHAGDDEIVDAVTRARQRVQRQLEEAETAAAMAARVASAAKLAQVAPAAVAAPMAGRIVTVFGTKGGVGKSVVATNLAATLAQHADGMVALVDANLQFGDAAIMLRLQPSHTIVEAAMADERLDADLLDDLLLRHEASGLRVLAAPTEPGSADQIKRPELVRILAVLREMCAYVVVDTSPHLDDATLVALENADEIVMLSGLDVMSLKNARVSLQALQVLGIPFGKIKFVVNRANGHSSLGPSDAERALQLKADATLPVEEFMGDAVNRGLPIAITTPASRFSRAIAGLAKNLTGREVTVASQVPSEPQLAPEGPTRGSDRPPESGPLGAEVGERAKKLWRKGKATAQAPA
jgi:pilus assembly protein CpaE